MEHLQLEKGYVRIPHELLNAMLATEFTGREFRIILAVIRYSMGWHKEEAHLTQKQIQQITGLSQRTISDCLRRLAIKNILTVVGTDTYMLQKDYTRWQIDQRRYKPLTEGIVSSYRKQAQDLAKATQNSTESDVNFYRKQCKDAESFPQEKPKNNKDLTDVAQSLRKDIIKDIYKNISLRERIFERLKKAWPDAQTNRTALNELRAVIDRYPERADFFLYLLETFKIDPQYVKHPVAYITSLRPISFPPLPDRERLAYEKQKSLKQQAAEAAKERAAYLDKERPAVQAMVKDFVKRL